MYVCVYAWVHGWMTHQSTPRASVVCSYEPNDLHKIVTIILSSYLLPYGVNLCLSDMLRMAI